MDLQILYIVCSIFAFLPGIVFHEFMHAFAAYKLGDDTAKQQGRISLNPLKHIDPFGTVILPALLILAGGPVFGYAKPVPYNPHNLKDPHSGDLIVGIAGPAANLVVALVGSAFMLVMSGISLFGPNLTFSYFYQLYLPLLIMINLNLMFFNLLPIPPLDGSSIFAFFLPSKYLPTYYRVQQYALPVFFLVIFVLPYVINVNPIGLYLQATAGNLGDLLIQPVIHTSAAPSAASY